MDSQRANPSRPAGPNRRRGSAALAGLFVVFALIAPIALAVPAAASASPSAIDEYKLNLPGGQGNAHKANSQEASDGNSAVVPILIGAGVVLTGGAVFMLARKRRQET